MNRPQPHPVKPLEDAVPEEIRFENRAMGFSCPICSDRELQVATVAGTQAACCRNCRGTLIDSESLGSIVQSLRASYQGSDDRPRPMDVAALDVSVHCPICQEAMYSHPYHGPGNVVINSCHRCQLTWLDQGELASIVRAPGRRMRPA